MLIAGFCCVDFSKLNSRPKGIDDRGESGDTFFAIRNYAKSHEPKMIVVENVVGAPWTAKCSRGNKSLQKYFEEIGYASRHVRLDTKEFYIPQTRNRGYMLVVHKQFFEKRGMNVEASLSSWEDLLRQMRRPASVPAEALTGRYDDGGLKVGLTEEVAVKTKVTAWTKCQVGHQGYREALELGNGNPITQRTNDGGRIWPEGYTRFSSERIADSMGITSLRGLRRGHDDRQYKSVKKSNPPTQYRTLTSYLAV